MPFTKTASNFFTKNRSAKNFLCPLILTKVMTYSIILGIASLQIWVSSPHNGSGFYGLKDEINDSLSQDHFQSMLAGGADLTSKYARTGIPRIHSEIRQDRPVWRYQYST